LRAQQDSISFYSLQKWKAIPKVFLSGAMDVSSGQESFVAGSMEFDLLFGELP
jgi:hypothetical protein